jgi:hypothetical protein
MATTTYQLSAIDLYDVNALWGEDPIESRELADLRVCRVSNCDDFADGHDEFCLRCRDEIEAVRAEQRESEARREAGGGRGRAIRPFWRGGSCPRSAS